MHAIHQAVAESIPPVDFRTSSQRYRHRELSSDGPETMETMETMETRIIRRLSAWQNWIFSTTQRCRRVRYADYDSLILNNVKLAA